MVNLRQETEADGKFLRSLYASVRDDEMAFLPLSDQQKSVFLDQQFDAQRQHYRTHYPDAEFMVITFDDKLAGRWYLHRDPEGFHLLDISLLPAYRGRGIGGYLLANLLAEADKQDKPVRLFVENGNRAQNLYLRHGFAVIEEHPVHRLMEWRSPNL